jgi:limonene-1,2-epoxide hydrolase
MIGTASEHTKRQGESDMSEENRAVVRSLADAWAAKDLDAIMDHFTDDIVYHNIPMDPADGTAAVRATVEGFLAMAETIEFDTLHELSDGNLVMNERVDTFVIDGDPTPIRVMGIFELSGGKIRRWRDYFDMAGLTGG